MKKRSVSIRGHKTSFSLEEEFWVELKNTANDANLSLAQLVTKIDATRGEEENLSSALRLHVLRVLKEKLADTIQN